MTLCRRCVWLFGDVVRTLCRALRAITGLGQTALTIKTVHFPKQSAINGPGNVVQTLCRRCVDVVRTLCMTLCRYVVQTFRLKKNVLNVVRRCVDVVYDVVR